MRSVEYEALLEHPASLRREAFQRGGSGGGDRVRAAEEGGGIGYLRVHKEVGVAFIVFVDQPEDRVWHAPHDPNPHLQRLRLDLNPPAVAFQSVIAGRRRRGRQRALRL